MCMSVCLSVHKHISRTTRLIFNNFCMSVTHSSSGYCDDEDVQDKKFINILQPKAGLVQ